MTATPVDFGARFDSLFAYHATEKSLDPVLLKAQAIAESNLDPKAVSAVGAKGLAQFMDKTWREIAPEGASPFNPDDAIAAQAKYLDRLLNAFDNDSEKAFAAYNWGMGNLRTALSKHGETWKDHLPKETQDYLTRIARIANSLRTTV